jgi:hypothetical protein
MRNIDFGHTDQLVLIEQPVRDFQDARVTPVTMEQLCDAIASVLVARSVPLVHSKLEHPLEQRAAEAVLQLFALYDWRASTKQPLLLRQQIGRSDSASSKNT